jgi:hypothetical protein
MAIEIAMKVPAKTPVSTMTSAMTMRLAMKASEPLRAAVPRDAFLRSRFPEPSAVLTCKIR